MNNFSCSLSCTWITIIDCLFYASDSLSWDVSWEYIASCVVVTYCYSHVTAITSSSQTQSATTIIQCWLIPHYVQKTTDIHLNVVGRMVILVQNLFILMLKRGAVALLQLIVFLMSYACKCSVAIPHGAMGWSAVYEWFRYILIILTWLGQIFY